MEKDLYEQGLKIRREVVGDAYVDKALNDADSFSLPMQELVTKYCWGDVWARSGLERRDRSLVNLGMIAALNRPDELQAHIRGAINNGVTKDEIREVLLQVAIYCGMPAGLGSFKAARQVFKEMGI
ncbi:4-carboxymuconolactone decarboxylase [Alcaligenaceae bacterium]|nr:4-carboxymuconolactone decarboxylase [Alcaligenaceae bacterium]